MRNPGKLAGIVCGLPLGTVAALALGANHNGWWSLLGFPIVLMVGVGLGALLDEWA